MEFVGRSEQLARLSQRLRDVASAGRGELLAVRGRRQVGKSRLVTEFVERSGAPHVYFTSVKNATLGQQLHALRSDVFVARRPLPNAEVLFRSDPVDWSDAFGRLRLAAQQQPIVAVLDEVPWAAEADATFEGRLQAAWDTQLERLPVLMILIGSNVSMMERLSSHDRPLYGRAKEQTVHPFNPAEVRLALGSRVTALTAFDAYLVTGGYPRLVEDLTRHENVGAFVRAELSDENSDLVVVAQRSLDSEFPPNAQARRVLSAIGGREVGLATFSSAVAALPESGKAAETGLSRALQVLVGTSRVVAVERPALSTPRTRIKRYRIDDPYLRLWFRFIEPQLAAIARGRGDIAVNAFQAGWPSWRGLAIEPVVRQALHSLGPGVPGLGPVDEVSSWWRRDNSVEVDIVASRGSEPVALGSIKWRDRRRLSQEELDDLARHRGAVPAAGRAALIAVCPAGLRSGARPDLWLDAEDLLSAWEHTAARTR